ncbi:AraC family transcriptional regulator [Shewanella inventionis]|uniref:AraC family transcriptional regulator n=1 Tax=Shewanella inventionis TaxID=1738770 RepID=UPI001CBC0E91|nr:GyrI-like domain-containing protein [Shewanella inventionis]UAL42356.1 AraC family transcriptional regulator [Shewanella inventionis]
MGHKLDQAFEKVLAYIDSNIAAPLDIDNLARIAELPTCHFEHLFYTLYRLSIEEYVELLKSLQAAHQLGFGEQVPLAAIAANLGYHNEADFVDSFTLSIGQSPQSFRQAPDWNNFFSKQQPLKSFESPQDAMLTANVEIVQMDALTLSFVTHNGPENALPQTIERFIQWRQKYAIGPNLGRTFNLVHSLPQAKPYHMDIGVSLDENTYSRLASTGLTQEGIYTQVISSGRYAKLSVKTDTQNSNINALLHAGVDYLYRIWLNEQPYSLRNSPLMFERLNIGGFAESGIKAHSVDIYLPLL